MNRAGTSSRKLLLSVTASLLALGSMTGAVHAADPSLDAQLHKLLNTGEATQYKRLTTIQVPGKPLAAFDISAVDPVLPLYYLADRSNGALDVFDTRTNTVAAQIGGFVGVRYNPATGAANNAVSGPDGVAVVGGGEVWVGDGDSTVKVADIYSQKIIATISTALPGQTAAQDQRADEMSYDPRDKIMTVANNAATPPYITFISTKPANRQVLGHLVYSDAAGVEASVYDPANGLFYINLTQVGTDPNNGAVSVVDPRTMTEVKRFPVTGCNGAGLALAPGQKLLVGCSLTNNSQIISARDGTLLATIPQASGSDEVIYNPGDNNFYLAARNNPNAAGGPVLGVINAGTNTFVTNVPTDVSAHSVAADPKTNHVFVPLGPIASDPDCVSGCIGVYTPKDSAVERGVEKLIMDFQAK